MLKEPIETFLFLGPPLHLHWWICYPAFFLVCSCFKTLSTLAVYEPKKTRLSVLYGSCRDDVLIMKSKNYQMTTDESGLCHLFITEPTLEDTGSYTCKAINQHGKDKTTCNVKISGICSCSFLSFKFALWFKFYLNSCFFVKLPFGYTG